MEDFEQMALKYYRKRPDNYVLEELSQREYTFRFDKEGIRSIFLVLDRNEYATFMSRVDLIVNNYVVDNSGRCTVCLSKISICKSKTENDPSFSYCNNDDCRIASILSLT